MIKISSTRKYRLDVLNNESPVPYTFDIFDNYNFRRMDYKLDDRYFCTTREQYLEKLKDDKIIKILADVNEKYNTPVAMISGSFALHHLFKKKKYEMLEDLNDGKKTVISKLVSKGRPFHKETGDVDIFILGKNKREVVVDILKEMTKTFTSPESFFIEEVCEGLYDIKIKSKSPTEDIPELLNISQGRFRLDHSDTLIYQLIIKEIHITPSDVFAFFDLDCCKIGIIPKKERIEVVTCPSFIRSVSYQTNFLDLYLRKAGYKHYQRICRYYRRIGIITTCVPEHMLSRFHNSFKKSESLIKNKNDIVQWEWWDMFTWSKTDRRFIKVLPGYYTSHQDDIYYGVSEQQKKMRKTRHEREFEKDRDRDHDDDKIEEIIDYSEDYFELMYDRRRLKEAIAAEKRLNKKSLVGIVLERRKRRRMKTEINTLSSLKFSISMFLELVEKKEIKVEMDLKKESYLTRSVGILRNKETGRYYYKDRDFSLIVGKTEEEKKKEKEKEKKKSNNEGGWSSWAM